MIAKNPIGTLDLVLDRPSHIDKKMEHPLPDEKIKVISQIHTSRMMLTSDIMLGQLLLTKDEFSCGDICINVRMLL
ncbi:26S proteasome regulatory subunit 4 [Galemys pyrenaicus]|uniref:26S proteasome regulatory subunit 4 n=1 Tax=Galemys pyrenaicus TaxID=202257 RepID=A0A8J6A6I4_GALPY|nr:26S proteasome regulatory subunit 4 [Galemys pyrenaicus]